jgi:phosphocarrier protein FPr/phosphocarrier protein
LAPPAVAAITGPASFAGVTASPGVAIGVAHVIALADAAIDETGKGVAYERARLDAALAAVGGRLKAEIAKGAAPYTDILQAHADLLDDPELVAKAASQIAAGKSAGRAWRAVMREQAEILGAMEDARMAERAADFVDLERQVLAMLRGDESGDALPENAVLIADEIYPSQLLRLDRARLAGIATARGGPTSHASILASSMGIPAIVALGPAVLGAAPGSTVIVDADKARVHVSPDDGIVAETRATQGRKRALRARALAAGAEDCRTADGARIEALANLASSAEAEIAAGNFAEGCGLLRTEFLFLNRSTPPSEAEQTAEYQAIADTLGNRPLVVRTLDVGADKSVPYIPLAKEENPALGLRGVRASLARPDLLEAQLRAILAVRPAGRCRIMLPMITSLAELRAVRAVLARHESDRPAALGVMIETPAAAVLADQLAAEADFLSIGTNDLAQYVLAMDRGNARLAAGIDALAPAVLRFIAMTGEAGARSGAPVGVCGGLASDFVAAPLLIGLGVGALSGAASRIPELKAFIRTLRKSECEAAARRALELEDSAAVRAFARQTWPQLDEWT